MAEAESPRKLALVGEAARKAAASLGVSFLFVALQQVALFKGPYVVRPGFGIPLYTNFPDQSKSWYRSLIINSGQKRCADV